jgi:hypothetical protein
MADSNVADLIRNPVGTVSRKLFTLCPAPTRNMVDRDASEPRRIADATDRRRPWNKPGRPKS